MLNFSNIWVLPTNSDKIASPKYRLHSLEIICRKQIFENSEQTIQRSLTLTPWPDILLNSQSTRSKANNVGYRSSIHIPRICTCNSEFTNKT